VETYNVVAVAAAAVDAPIAAAPASAPSGATTAIAIEAMRRGDLDMD
jgi:hypothetical protein